MSRTVRRRDLVITATTLQELGADDFARWQDLERRAIEPYPQIGADYLQTAQLLRPGAQSMRLLIVSRGDDWLLVLPFTLGHATDRARVRAITTADETMDHESAKLYPLMDLESGARALDAALGRLSSLGLPRLARIVLVDDLPPVLAALRGSVGGARSRLVEGAQVVRPLALASGARKPLPAPGAVFPAEYALPETSSSTRRKMGRLARRLSESVGALSVVVRDGDDAMVDDFLALQTAGWKGDPSRGGEGYDATGRTAWYRAYTRGFHEKGELLGVEFRGNGRVLYSTLVLRRGRVIHGLQDAYDEEFAEFSVGTLGRRAVLSVVRDLDIDLFDPNMSWYNFEAARVYPDRRGQRELVLAGPGLRSRSAILGIRAARAARDLMSRRTKHGADADASTDPGGEE